MNASVPYFDQSEWEVRFEWGRAGVATLTPLCDAIVIVDVLSFCTSVDIAVNRGAWVYPFAWRDERATAYAQSIGALLATPGRQSSEGYSLSPSSLLQIPSGTRLVLPSPNGSTLTLATEKRATFAGCLRNAAAVAHTVSKVAQRIGVIAGGERWPDGSLRPAIEDLLGAGAIIEQLPGTRSPEAQIAATTFRHCQATLASLVREGGSGKELIGRGFEHDVELATMVDSSDCVPFLHDSAYRRY